MATDTQPEPYAGPDFEYDVFVSYSHGIPPESGEKSDLHTWTHALVDKLKEHVGYSLKQQRRPIKVWYDAKLRGNVSLTDTLKQSVERSALLLVVMTEHYLTSEWCRKEVTWFEGEVKRRGSGLESVLVVRAMSTDDKDWPDALRDSSDETVIGYPFCNEAEGNDARPYGWVQPSASDTQANFFTSLTDVAAALAGELDRIRGDWLTGQKSGNGGAGNGSPKPNWHVLVAPGTEEVRPFGMELREELEERECAVLPSEEIGIEKFSEQAETEALSNADALVQLIGVTASKDEGADIGKVQLLNKRATDMSMKQFLWRNAAVSVDVLSYDPTYKKFVESLGEIPDRSAKELADAIVTYLLSEESGTVEPLMAFMEVPADALKEFERWQRDIWAKDCVLLPHKGPTAGTVREIQNERTSKQFIYLDCDAVLLMYCKGGQLDWLRGALINCLKDITAVKRKAGRSPTPVVVDYTEEAKDLTATIGVDRISWKEGSDPDELWKQIRGLTR